jgi:hypothetical protein
VPFEVFDKVDGPSKGQVAVLWLDEDELLANAKPLTNIFRLVCAVRPPADGKVAVLGPQDSTTLEAMGREIEDKPRPRESCPDGAKLHLFNYGATAQLQQVLDPEQWPSHAGISYFRNVSSDQQVAAVLADELVRRGVDITEPTKCPDAKTGKPQFCDHIALISEWDTVYGRSLRDTMSGALASRDTMAGARASDESPIEYYSYLRGLDGRSANRKLPKSDDASDGKDSNKKSADQTVATPDTASQFESAEGQSQFDYLRRIAERIRDRDHELRRSGRGRIAAIGILGSDVYDKLLILQALRPIFADAVYFTTDLDELLLPQKKSHYTRNLLVASSYGLTLRPELQGDVPPFRSTYQSSIFLATQLAERTAFSHSEPSNGQDATDEGPKLQKQLKQWSGNPPLFQIGRTAPFTLPYSESAHSSDACDVADMVKCSYVRPAVAELYPEFEPSARYGVFLSPLLLGLLFILPGIRKASFYKIGQCKRWDLAPPLLLLAGCFVIWRLLILDWPVIAKLLTERGNGEPMSLLEGISIWPAVALSGFGIVLSLFLIWYTLRILDINTDETKKNLDLEDISPELHRPAEACRLAREALCGEAGRIVWFVSLLWLPPLRFYKNEGFDDLRPRVSFGDIFAGGYSAKWQIRCLRAAVYTGLMMLVWWKILVPIFGAPNIPARGSLAHYIYIYVTRTNVIATLFLTFLVTDATLYSRATIARLMEISTVWPLETRRRFGQNFALQDDNLADWIDMQYLVMRTSCITQLIYFPFLALTALILSRSELFTDFSMPWTLPIAQAICLGVIIASVLVYRSTAEAARKVAHDRLTEKIATAKQVKEGAADQLELLLNEVENLKVGAFAPLTAQPVVRAVLLPLLTYGGTVLVHLYALPGS